MCQQFPSLRQASAFTYIGAGEVKARIMIKLQGAISGIDQKREWHQSMVSWWEEGVVGIQQPNITSMQINHGFHFN